MYLVAKRTAFDRHVEAIPRVAAAITGSGSPSHALPDQSDCSPTVSQQSMAAAIRCR